MQKEINISIIMPCYNCEKFLEVSLGSLINQKNKKFEIIFIDDGSKDNSAIVAAELLKSSGIKHIIINQENRGVSYSRNKCLELASGDYIYFLDSDDYVNENFIELVLNKLVNKSKNMLICSYNILKDSKVMFKYKFTNKNLNGKEFIKAYFKNEVQMTMCNCIIRKDVIKKNNIIFNESAYVGEDIEFLVKALFWSENVELLNETLYYYCSQKGSASNKFDWTTFTAVQSFENIKTFLIEKGSAKEIIRLSERRIAQEVLRISNLYCKSKDELKVYENKLMEVIRKNKKGLIHFGIYRKYDLYLKFLCVVLAVNFGLYKKLLKFKWKVIFL
jgi:glycosyltransferase involved in cell wall biosynthesis